MAIRRKTGEVIEEVDKSKRERIEIQYEPYFCQISILNSSIELNKNSRTNLIIKKNKGKVLYIWVEEFIKSIGEDFNSKCIKIIFKGRKEEIGDLLEAINKFNENGWELEVEFVEVTENKKIIEECKEYLKEIENCKIESLKEEFNKYDVRKKFEEANNSDVEIGVIATMSSGKSTLINAMLGQEILPSKNEACTATICRIENDKFQDEFIYRTEYIDRKEKSEWKKIDIKELKQLNENTINGVDIHIKGKFIGIDDNEMKIILVDTPGPNSSLNLRHKEITYNFVKDSMKNPIVLYVLNATQLATNDDATLLKEIAEEIEKNGKQAEERFIFALNKIDCFDPEKESIENLIRNAKKYLANFGIEKPRIFPVSAEAAKLYRMKEIGIELTRSEENDYENYLFKILPTEDYEGIETFENSSLPENLKEEIRERIKLYPQEMLLHYSGITAIEMYINRYISKYAKALKVRNAITTMKDVVDLFYSEKSMLKGKNEKELEKISKEIEELQTLLEVGESRRIQEIKEKINNLNIYETSFKNLFIKMEEKFSELDEILEKKDVNPRKAICILERISEEISELYVNLKVNILNTSLKELQEKINELIEKMREVYDEELSKISLEELKKILEQQLKLELPKIASMLDLGYYTRDELKNRKPVTRFVGVEKKRKWYSPLSWIWPDEEPIYETVYEEEYETKEYINLQEVRDICIRPIKTKLRKQIFLAQEELQNKLTKIKENGLEKVEILEKNIEENILALRQKVEIYNKTKKNFENFQVEYEKVTNIKVKLEKIVEGE